MDRRSALLGMTGVIGAGATLGLVPKASDREVAASPPAPAAPPVAQVGKAPVKGVIIRSVPLGGGGFVTGIDISPDGRRLACRTDVGNAFVRDNTSSDWRPLFSPQTMTAADYDPLPAANEKADGMGVAALRIAPSNPDVIYSHFLGYLWRSIDGGRTIRRTTAPQSKMLSNAGVQRLFNRAIDVHPLRPETITFGSQGDGSWLSNNGGERWTKLGLPLPGRSYDDQPGVILLSFDPSSPDRLYGFVTGSGLHVSDHHETAPFRLLPGGPPTCSCLVVRKDGTVFVCEATKDVSGALWRYSPQAGWRSTKSNRELLTLAIDPRSQNGLLGIDRDGFFLASDDGGETLRNIDGGSWKSGGEVGWMAGLRSLYPAEIRFHPIEPNRVMIAHGTGVASGRYDVAGGRLELRDMSAGIEELCAVDGMSVPGGATYFSALDLPFWKLKDQNSYRNDFRYPVVAGKTHDESLVVPGGFLDYAPDDKNYLVGVVGLSDRSTPGYSDDGGESWKAFSGTPETAWGFGGCIAVNSGRNIVLLPSNNGVGVFSLDGGKSWAPVKLDGVHPTDKFANAFYVLRKNITADKTRRGVFSLVYTIIGNNDYSNVLGGVWLTTNGGATWEQTFKGVISSERLTPQQLNSQQQDERQFWNCQLAYVPNHSRELVYTPHTDYAADRFFWSPDDGRSWSELHPDVRNVERFGFGKSLEGQERPAVYFWGSVRKVQGLYVSFDWFKTAPLLLTRFPSPTFGTVKQITGDSNVFGRVYVGTRCSGWVRIDVQLS